MTRPGGPGGGLLLVLHSGDYLEARRRREEGQSDRYRHHSYALDSLDRLRDAGVPVTVVSVFSATVYDEVAATDLRFVGLGGGKDAVSRLRRLVDDVRPDHTMLRFPDVDALRALRHAPGRLGVVLADSFPEPRRHLLGYRRLGRLLRAPGLDFVANHHLAGSRQLVDVLRLDPRRVVPWDWPLDLRDLASGPPKPHRGSSGLRLFYAGALSPAKGVLDLLDAVEQLAQQGVEVCVELAGAGGGEQLNRRVDELAEAGLVRRLGRIGGDEVLARMGEADLVLVPSRHGYPEGLPLTIYEAMASGTPLVASDHPMFAGVVREGETGFVFRAGDARSLVDAVRRAWADPSTYTSVSGRARAAYPGLGLSTLWGELLERWVRGDPEDLAWLRERSLAAQR